MVIIHQKHMKNPKMSIIFRIILHRFLLKKTMVQPAPASSHAAWPLLEASHASVAAGPLGWTPPGAWSAGNPHRGVKTWISMKCWVYGGSTRNASPFLDRKSVDPPYTQHFRYHIPIVKSSFPFLDRLKCWRWFNTEKSEIFHRSGSQQQAFGGSAWRWTGSVKSK